MAMSSPSPLLPFDDQTSLTGSLGDFSDSDKQHSPLFGLPSQHSGFRSSSDSDHEDGAETGEAESDGSPWSPPAWRQSKSSGGWYRHQPYPQDVERLKSHSASRSRGTSKGYESARGDEDEDATLAAARIPLPRASTSPIRESRIPTTASPTKERASSCASPPLKAEDGIEIGQAEEEDVVAGGQNANNCLYLPYSNFQTH